MAGRAAHVSAEDDQRAAGAGQDWKTHAGLSAARQSVEAELAGRGRILIRASGTEPKLRLMVEAEDEALAVSSPAPPGVIPLGRPGRAIRRMTAGGPVVSAY